MPDQHSFVLTTFDQVDDDLMTRRLFVTLAAGTTASLYLPSLGCNSQNRSLTQVLSQPNELEHICDTETIREIGNAYQKLFPNETKKSLTKFLSDYVGDQSNSSKQVAMSALERKVREDFQENKTIVVDGWVLSVTEARQCALFAMTQN